MTMTITRIVVLIRRILSDIMCPPVPRLVATARDADETAITFEIDNTVALDLYPISKASPTTPKRSPLERCS